MFVLMLAIAIIFLQMILLVDSFLSKKWIIFHFIWVRNIKQSIVTHSLQALQCIIKFLHLFFKFILKVVKQHVTIIILLLTMILAFLNP